jgi:hypothetical protein
VKIPGFDNKQNRQIPPLVIQQMRLSLAITRNGVELPCAREMPKRPDTGEKRMNIYEELKTNIESFKIAREHAISCAALPSSNVGFSCGEPPFAIDDGINYYAVIDGDGKVSPLPFGYQVPDELMQDEGVEAVYSHPVTAVRGGFDIARYVPLVEDYEIPGERAFCLETAEDSEVFETVGRLVESVQAMVTEKAVFNFNQRLSNVVVSLFDRFEELESVDQAIGALALESSVLPTLLLRSYQHALDKLEEEMSVEEDDDDE